jgi:hypothetical protein
MRKDFIAFAFLFLLLSGCAITGLQKETAPHINRPGSEALRDAVERYWNLRVQGDLYRSYDYERVAYLKKTPRELYASGFGKGIVFKNFRILEIGPEGSGPKGLTPVKLEVELSYQGLPFPTPDSITQTRLDYWEKEKDGRWYHIISKAGKFD